MNVSIHAPARGAMFRLVSELKHDLVSIHAPARGAIPLDLKLACREVFQFTHPQGVRLLSAL